MHAVHLGLHLVAARIVEGENQLLGAGNFRGFVGGDIVSQRGVVADALDRVCHILEIEFLVNRMFGVTGQPKLLPHGDSQLIAELEEIV